LIPRVDPAFDHNLGCGQLGMISHTRRLSQTEDLATSARFAQRERTRVEYRAEKVQAALHQQLERKFPLLS
jgi:hypothetical protein